MSIHRPTRTSSPLRNVAEREERARGGEPGDDVVGTAHQDFGAAAEGLRSIMAPMEARQIAASTPLAA